MLKERGKEWKRERNQKIDQDWISTPVFSILRPVILGLELDGLGFSDRKKWIRILDLNVKNYRLNHCSSDLMLYQKEITF